MIFTTVDSALAYLKEKLQAFYDQSRVLRDRLHDIGRLKQVAREKDDQAALSKLARLQRETEQLFREQLDLEQTLAPFAQYFGTRTGLGAVPVLIAGGAILAAGALYLHFEKLNNQEQALALVADGLLTPQEAHAMLEAGSLLGTGGLAGLAGNVGMILALVVGGFVLYQVMPRRR